jgi:L-ascorbate metabolism protein UlaG (beta-lactamase superfamily)
MHLTRYGHACIRLEHNGTVIVIDPGVYSDPRALDGAHAVLVTHEHADHFAEAAVRAAAEADPAMRIWADRPVADQLGGLGGRVTAVGDGDTIDIEGIGVEVHGELHAPIHPDMPTGSNVGFLLDGTVFHPGDAFTVPTRPVDTLLVPVHGPWSKTGEVIDYLREIKPRRALPIHDGGLSEGGNELVDSLLGAGVADFITSYARVTAEDGTELA